MILVAIDTSGDACSVALLRDGVLHQRLESAPRRHGELALAMLDGLLAEEGVSLAETDAIAFSRGPGSFTGVRISVALAQGVAFAAGLPTIPVCTLAAIAQGQHLRTGRRRILAALDARMGEVYWGAFELGADGLVKPVGTSLVCPPASVPMPSGPDWWGAGPGWLVYEGVLMGRLGELVSGFDGQAICEAGSIATLAAGDLRAGRLVAPELARPVYLRDRVTQRG